MTEKIGTLWNNRARRLSRRVDVQVGVGSDGTVPVEGLRAGGD